VLRKKNLLESSLIGDGLNERAALACRMTVLSED